MKYKRFCSLAEITVGISSFFSSSFGVLTQAAVLFNLGALQSQIALQTERSSDAGVKDAAKLFQVGRTHQQFQTADSECYCRRKLDRV